MFESRSLIRETHGVPKDEKIWTNQFGFGKGSVIIFHGKSDSGGGGVLINFRETVNYKTAEQYIVYILPGELSHIFDQLDTAENTTLIMRGDFTTIFDTYLDDDGGTPKMCMKSVSKLLSLMPEDDLCDIYRLRNPDIR